MPLDKGLTGIRTRNAGFKVQSDSRYTIRPGYVYLIPVKMLYIGFCMSSRFWSSQ